VFSWADTKQTRNLARISEFSVYVVFKDGQAFKKTLIGADVDGTILLPVADVAVPLGAKVGTNARGDIIIYPPAAPSDEVVSGDDVLQGLKGLRVLVEEFDAPTQSDAHLVNHDFTQIGVKSHVETMLRVEHVLAADRPDPDVDDLYVDIGMAKVAGQYSFNIRVQVLEPCYSKRTMKLISNARVWDESATGSAQPDGAADYIYSQLDKYINDLLNAWAKTHPSMPSTHSSKDGTPVHVGCG
jgi:hypothetical protein